jgi:hypothetical protein
MEIVVIIVLLAAVGVWLLRRSLQQNLVNNATKRVMAMKEMAETRFVAAPGDERLKPDWEYLVALKKPNEKSYTGTFFTKASISHTQSGITEDDVFALREQGWHINGQSFKTEGHSWQLERPKPQAEPA